MDVKVDHIDCVKDLTSREKEAVETFIHRLGSENAFGDGIAVAEKEAIKFLMARKFDVGRAISLFHTNRMLRGRFELEHLEPMKDPLASELNSGKFTVSCSKGPEEDTLCIFYARHHLPKLVDHVTVLQSIVFQLDSIMKKIDAQRHGLSFIYDMTSSGYLNFDFDLAMKVLHLLKGGYPARLKHVYILAPPFWFRASMTVLSSFLRDKIKDRVEVVRNFPELFHRVPQDYLPKELGGSVEHNHSEWLEECMKHFKTSMSTINLKNHQENSSEPTQNSIQDSRGIFEDAENHEKESLQQPIPTIIEQPPTPSSENEPPPLPPRPPHRSPQPSPKSSHSSDFNRSLPPEPVPAFDNISDTDSISEQVSPGREAFSIVDLMAYMNGVGKKGIHKEYEELRSLPPSGTFDSTLYPVNTKKNRYNNILTFEETRVKLERIDQDPFSDYINANYVNGFETEKKFICTQGPTPYTYNDFWRMVWEQKVGIIVMVTRCMERNRIKCGNYWPQQPEDCNQYGGFVVENIEQNVGKDFTVNEFTIANLESEFLRTVYHIQFTSWPDFGVLASASPILQVIDFIETQQPLLAEKLREEQDTSLSENGDTMEVEVSGEYQSPEISSPSSNKDNNGDEKYPPVIIHCSAGVGRTGTFCCLSNTVERLRKTGKVDIFSTVKSIREQRAFSVQTPEQYQFGYTGILDYVLKTLFENGEDTGDVKAGLIQFLRREASDDSE